MAGAAVVVFILSSFFRSVLSGISRSCDQHRTRQQNACLLTFATTMRARRDRANTAAYMCLLYASPDVQTFLREMRRTRRHVRCIKNAARKLRVLRTRPAA